MISYSPTRRRNRYWHSGPIISSVRYRVSHPSFWDAFFNLWLKTSLTLIIVASSGGRRFLRFAVAGDKLRWNSRLFGLASTSEDRVGSIWATEIIRRAKNVPLTITDIHKTLRGKHSTMIQMVKANLSRIKALTLDWQQEKISALLKLFNCSPRASPRAIGVGIWLSRSSQTTYCP